MLLISYKNVVMFLLIILAILKLFLYVKFTLLTSYTIVHRSTNTNGVKWVYDDEDSIRCLTFVEPPRNIPLSCMDLTMPERLILDYSKMFFAGIYVKQEKPKRILMLGLGGVGILPALKKLFPEAAIDSVENDGEMIQIADTYFSCRSNRLVRVHNQDAAEFVRQTVDGKYDWIIMDAFFRDGKSDLLTTEFVFALKRILRTDGVVSVNSFLSGGKYYRVESELYSKVFGNNLIGLHNEDTRAIIAYKGSLSTSTPSEIVKKANIWNERFKQIGIQTDWLLRTVNHPFKVYDD